MLAHLKMYLRIIETSESDERYFKFGTFMTVLLRLRFVVLQCRGIVCKLLWDTLPGYQERD